jgi:hypothetical protein
MGLGKRLRGVPGRYRKFIVEQERFPGAWMSWYGKKSHDRYKIHLTDKVDSYLGPFNPWCGNVPPPDASYGWVGGPMHYTQICEACRAIAIANKLQWNNMLWKKEEKSLGQENA